MLELLEILVKLKSWNELYLLIIEMWMMLSKFELSCLKDLRITLALRLDYWKFDLKILGIRIKILGIWIIMLGKKE